MTTGPLGVVVRDLRRAVVLRDAAGTSDEQLLEWFLAQRDETAFEALVRRHGPMVLGVCRRVLRHAHDADDAFQATFLVLMRKAASITKREALGAWLYGVAYRIAVRAKAMNARRRSKERQAAEWPRSATPATDGIADLEPLLDREVNRLPEKYRVPLVLCELQGTSRKDAALQLGLPEGTLSSRLARAREMLRRRLLRKGVVVGTSTLAAILSPGAASAALPAGLVATTVRAAALFEAGQGASGVLSANVVALAEGALRSLLLSKLKVAVVLLLGIGLCGLGAGVGTYHALSELAAAPSTVAEAVRSIAAPAKTLPKEEELAAADDDPSEPPLDDADMPDGEAPIGPPPAALNCDPFYQKHLSAGGLPVLSSAKVSDRALREAAYLVNSILQTRPDLRAAMIEGDVRFLVMHPTEKTTDLPEQRHMRPKEYWDRVRDLGGRLNSCGEENLLNLPDDRYHGQNNLVHVIAHGVHLKGLNRLDKNFDRRLRQLYKSALAKGLWKTTRAASSHAEYWAEGVQSYFDCNNHRARPRGAASYVNSREDLHAYDPALFALIDEVFRGTTWRYQQPDERD